MLTTLGPAAGLGSGDLAAGCLAGALSAAADALRSSRTAAGAQRAASSRARLPRKWRTPWRLAGPGIGARGLAARCADLMRGRALGVGLVELQAVGHARIEEHLDRGEGDHEPLGDAVERQLHLEALVVDDQVPEAVLQDDRHLLGVFLLQPLGQHDPRRVRLEGNVEMVLARQTGLGDAHQHSANDAAHRALRQRLVIDFPLGSHAQQKTTGPPVAQGSGGLLLPGALRNRA